MLEDNTIRAFDGNELSYEEFLKKAKSLSESGLDVYVGTDSQIIKESISIATCICFYKRGIKRNQIFHIKRKILKEKYPTLRARMLLEAYTSLEVALEIDPAVKSELIIHLDVGSDTRRNRTAKFSAELQMLVKSQGFGCAIKPDSWASSAVADKYSKT